jgi:DNA-binding MarR family transcriptional regulator
VAAKKITRTIFEELSPRELAGNMAGAFPNIDRNAVETFIAFRKFACRVHGFFERHWLRHGVTHAGAMVLIQLFHSRNAGLRPSEIALFEHVSRASVSGVIANLDKQGLIDRRREESDRRSVRVVLSPKGKRLLARVMPAGMERIHALMGSLPVAEQQSFRSTLSRLDDVLTKIEAAA